MTLEAKKALEKDLTLPPAERAELNARINMIFDRLGTVGDKRVSTTMVLNRGDREVQRPADRLGLELK